MSLPRPGGYPGENKKEGSSAGSAPSAFAGYNPPPSTPSPFGNSAALGSAAFGQGANAAGIKSGTFTSAGVQAANSGGFGGHPGGALGGGGGGRADGWNQYGFSRGDNDANINFGGEKSATRMGMGAPKMGNMPGADGRSSMGPAASGDGSGAAGTPLDWQQWAPEGMNSQMLGMGGNVARNILMRNVTQYQPRVSGYWNVLKAYFAVDNRYVLKKMKVLLLPVMKRDWYRQPSEDEVKDDGRPKYERPTQDVNAPDLYIPLMAFITFVLITGYAKGAAAAKGGEGARFSPEVLTEVTSTCVVIQLLEVLVIRLGLYLLASPAAVLDIVAYTGYRYVGLCINMAIGLFLGRNAYYLSLLWTGLMISYFMFKTMAHTIPTGGSSSREIMILGFGTLQLIGMWWLGPSGDLE